ncbi:MAG TPA: class I SAM-dependent methyltransferase [Burkholderiales bacterium]|nr:class I SAM-dependent methyltransferase [Burkholderiales bacterium]
MGEKKRRAQAGAGGKRDDRPALALAERAQALLAQSAFAPALEHLMRALELAPHLDALWAQFGEVIRFFNFRHPLDARIRTLLERALDHPAVDPGELVRPITSTALSRDDAFAEPLLLRLMQDAVVRDPRLQELIGAERERVNLPLEVLAAIAHQCFNTEYLLDDSAAPPASTLQQPADYARYAAYRPLHTLPDAARIAAELARTPLALLAQRQILEPLEERRLAAEIPTIGKPQGTVSAAVREQYEANPYPRWMRTQTHFTAAPLAEIVRELFPGTPAKAGAARILVAGCGTGQNAIATARRFADSTVLAVDLSLASLGYARRKTDELGLSNIAYRHADLLSLGALRERFQLVEASGVLHHLEDALVGWRVLAGLVEPGGFMRIGLYSESGRRHVTHAREFVAKHGFEATADGIRRARAAILAAKDDPLLVAVTRSEDFYSLSGCRDLLFHVQELRFSLPQIATMISDLRLEFLGFEFPDSGITASRYRARFPDDPALTNLANWHRFEEEHPETFVRMYQFWVRKPN